MKRAYLILDLVRTNHLGLNPTESILASCLYGLLAQDPIRYNGQSYYAADYKMVASYCPILPDKVDTLRRLYKVLEAKNLISTIRIDGHICFTPADMLREWGTEFNPQNGYFANEPENNPFLTENNPVKAEKNPVTPINNYKSLESINNTAPGVTASASDSERITLFANSEVARMVKTEIINGREEITDISELKKHFNRAGLENVDFIYYYYAVKDWSDQKQMKRTRRGWLGTINNFIRRDADKGQVHCVKQIGTSVTGADTQAKIDFLNNDF